MNVYDFHDAKADLKDFAFNCRRLLQLETILKQKRKEIDQLSMHSGSVAVSRDKSHVYKEDDHSRMFELMEEMDGLELEYTALRTRIRLISKALASMHLDERQIKLLQLSYEANQTIRTTARIMKLDPVTTWEQLNKISLDFASRYGRLLSTTTRSKQSKEAMQHPEIKEKMTVLDALDII